MTNKITSADQDLQLVILYTRRTNDYKIRVLLHNLPNTNVIIWKYNFHLYHITNTHSIHIINSQ